MAGLTTRSCIFCGQQSLTKEDAWPLWLMRLRYANTSGVIEAQRGDEELKPWRSKDPRLIIKYVCLHCNNGWMSNLEGSVKPIIETLLDTKSVLISSQEQAILSAWAVKNAMVFEGMRPSTQTWFYSASERKALMDTLQLPINTDIWIAKNVNNSGPYCSAYSTTGIVIESRSQVSGYITTIAFGELAIQVSNIKLPTFIRQETEVISLRPGPWDQATLHIYPSEKDVNWPPAIELQGEIGLQDFDDRWKVDKSA